MGAGTGIPSPPQTDPQTDPQVGAAVACLAAGGIVLVPTDTVYGLAVRPEFPAAVERLYALKRRPRERALPIMVAEGAALTAIGVEISPAARRLLDSALVPGALTLALGLTRETPETGGAARRSWLAGRDEVAVRIPAHPQMLAILRRTGALLVTSANLHGAATPLSLAECLEQLAGAPDLAIDGGLLGGVPSTLVNCRRSPPVIERLGAIPEAAVWACLQDLGGVWHSGLPGNRQGMPV